MTGHLPEIAATRASYANRELRGERPASQHSQTHSERERLSRIRGPLSGRPTDLTEGEHPSEDNTAQKKCEKVAGKGGSGPVQLQCRLSRRRPQHHIC